MSSNNSIFCPQCKQRTSVETRANKAYDHTHLIRYEIGECNNCEQHFLVIRVNKDNRIAKIYPTALPEVVDPAIPDRIKADLEEALVCNAAGAHRASCVMARRAMQNICLDKGAPKTRTITDKTGKTKQINNDLINQIDWLFDERIITKDLKDWAHEIRTVGNSGAHPASADDPDSILPEDATDILDLVRAFCEPLYVASQKYASRKERRTTQQDEA